MRTHFIWFSIWRSTLNIWRTVPVEVRRLLMKKTQRNDFSFWWIIHVDVFLFGDQLDLSEAIWEMFIRFRRSDLFWTISEGNFESEPSFRPILFPLDKSTFRWFSENLFLLIIHHGDGYFHKVPFLENCRFIRWDKLNREHRAKPSEWGSSSFRNFKQTWRAFLLCHSPPLN